MAKVQREGAVTVSEKLAELNHWLLGEDLNGRGANWAGARLCERMVSMGVPICRGHVLVLTLHPLYHARSFFWNRDTGVQAKDWPHGIQNQPGWSDSIFRALIAGELAPRQRVNLLDPSAGADFPMFEELRSEGITDYIAFRMTFSNGSMHAASFATDAPDGFSESDRELVFGLERLLAVRLENFLRRTLASTILGAYLGTDAAQRVLEGRIKRDDIDSISSVVWMSDLRGFTALSDRLEAKALLELLGDYFTVVVQAIRAEGGEVLKFIGDAVLAVFRVEARSPADACQAAVRAARQVTLALDEANVKRTADGRETIHMGSDCTLVR